MRLSFHRFAFDSDAHELTRDGAPIPLTPKAFRLLGLLLEERPNPVPKGELMERLWPGVHVVEGNLASLVSEIRTALRTGGSEDQFIRTVHRVGYAFVAPVIPPRRSESPRAAAFRLVSPRAELALSEGTNTIGREGQGLLLVDSVTVSRQHACIAVRGSSATIYDLDSKNGTFVNGERVREPVPLKGGDAVRLGSEEFVFRAALMVDTATLR